MKRDKDDRVLDNKCLTGMPNDYLSWSMTIASLSRGRSSTVHHMGLDVLIQTTGSFGTR